MTVGPQTQIDDSAEESTRILRLQWEPTAAFTAEPGAAAQVSWVVQSWGRSRTADSFAAALRAADPGITLIRSDVCTPSDGALSAFGNRPERHVFFIDETVPLAELDPSDDTAWAWALALVRACRQASTRPAARLWIVTRTGLHGPRRPGPVRPEHDFAWALGRCHAAESPGSWGGLIDLGLDDPGEAGRMLAGYLLSGSDEDEVLLRGEGPSVARLHVSTLPPAASGSGISPERLHIVSGGLTGLSFELGRWLARRGVKRLLVLGRSPLDSERERNLRLLQSLGCTVDYQVLDVGKPDLVRGLAQRLRDSGETVGGVFHLASTWQVDGQSCVASFASTTDEQTRVLLRTKAAGALLLADLAEQVDAEALLLFSSAAATLGSPGQANYAASNAVLDGVARRLHGGPVRSVSIAWGPIGEVGFGATREGADLHDLWQRLGLSRLTVAKMLSTVAMALSQDEPNICVIAWDDTAPDALPWSAGRPVLAQLSTAQPVGLSLKGLHDLDDEQRVQYIADVIRGRLAEILNWALPDVDADKSLLELGVDSLIALEFLFVVQREFAIRLELDEVMASMEASLSQLARQLAERIRAKTEPVPAVDGEVRR